MWVLWEYPVCMWYTATNNMLTSVHKWETIVSQWKQDFLLIDDFEFAINSINWTIDTQITEKYPFTSSVYAAWLAKLYSNASMWMEKNRNDLRSGLPSICFQHRKEICMKVKTINMIFTLENCCCREAVWGSLTSECNTPLLLKEYRCTDCKHSVCTRFFFLLLFLGEKDTAHCIDVVHHCQPVRMIWRA